MLLGDLLTAVQENLPIKVVVYNNGRLGMVKLEQEQGGLPEFGTVLENPTWPRSPARSVCTGSVSNGLRSSTGRSRRRSRTPARCCWTRSPTPTRSPSRRA